MNQNGIANSSKRSNISRKDLQRISRKGLQRFSQERTVLRNFFGEDAKRVEPFGSRVNRKHTFQDEQLSWESKRMNEEILSINNPEGVA